MALWTLYPLGTLSTKPMSVSNGFVAPAASNFAEGPARVQVLAPTLNHLALVIRWARQVRVIASHVPDLPTGFRHSRLLCCFCVVTCSCKKLLRKEEFSPRDPLVSAHLRLVLQPLFLIECHTDFLCSRCGSHASLGSAFLRYSLAAASPTNSWTLSKAELKTARLLGYMALAASWNTMQYKESLLLGLAIS